MAAEQPEARTVEATINYVARGSFINRRFVAPGVERNTGRYEAHRVAVRDGRALRDQFSLDLQGFLLADRSSAVTDFFEHQRETKGSYTHRGGVQPPAGEAHVDFTPARAEPLARTVYEKTFPDGKGFSRFIASSLWRAFSPPPQDFPLAVCDARSVGADEGVPNTMFVVERLPDEQAMLGEIANEATAPAAAIFHYNPQHRWGYFSNMTRREVLLFKFHDSDRTKALRTPHTAFQDPSFPNARPRESIEFRTIAYFE